MDWSKKIQNMKKFKQEYEQSKKEKLNQKYNKLDRVLKEELNKRYKGGFGYIRKVYDNIFGLPKNIKKAIALVNSKK